VNVRRLGAVVGIWLMVLFGCTACAHGPDPFEPLRQATAEPIPGTFSYVLEPVGGFRPTFDPDATYQGLTKRTTGIVSVTLAIVHDTDFGRTWGPAWVFFTRDVCFATSKGDLVSPGRSGNDACSDANMWVQVIDANDGASLGSFSAYDGTGRWLPDRVGDPSQVAGTTRFH
jgi:hypothetical protein